MRQRNPCCRAAVGELLGENFIPTATVPLLISVSGLLPYTLPHARGWPYAAPKANAGPTLHFIMRFPPNTTARAQKSGALPLP